MVLQQFSQRLGACRRGGLRNVVSKQCLFVRHASQESSPVDPSAIDQSSISSAHGDEPIESSISSFASPGPSAEQIASYNPTAFAAARKRQLPPSRYKFRPPKHYRGPLHPHQPPPPSSPASREFIPGPFSLPRLQQTYESTLCPDLMVLSYNHIPPGTPKTVTPQRLRSWDDSNPYYKNRPLRPPRAKPHLQLLKKPITFRNVPELSKITVSTIVKGATENSAFLHVAGMALQAITSVRAHVHMAKRSFNESQLGYSQRAGKPIALSCTITGEDKYHFLSQLVEIVLPRIKDWKGMSGASGDLSGNMALGLPQEVVGTWPEIAVNYDAYPPKMIPGLDIIIHTTATNNRDARLLLSSMGVPFYGKHKNQ